MPLGTPYLSETVPVVENGVIANVPASSISGMFTNVKTPTKTFAFAYKGETLNFQVNVPVVCDAALVSALTAAGAPVQ